MFFDYAAFGDELSKIAKEKKRESKAIYSPGVVAHEAGHAWLHRHPKKPGQETTDVMGLARSFGPIAAGGAYLAGKGLSGKPVSGPRRPSTGNKV